MQKKKIYVLIIALVLLMFYIINESDDISSEDKYEISEIIDLNIDKILKSSTIDLSQSNPYAYTDNQFFNEIVLLGDNALSYLFSELESATNSGLREYIIALACIEILELEEDKKTWSTGKEWYEQYKAE